MPRWTELQVNCFKESVSVHVPANPLPARILIADDDPVFCTVASSCLNNSGCESVTVGDGAAAMELLLKERFDLAIVDLVMPQIDGLRLIALIRATRRIRELPILIITSRQDPSLRAEGLQVGANDFLTKPVDWAELPGKIAALLNRCGA